MKLCELERPYGDFWKHWPLFVSWEDRSVSPYTEHSFTKLRGLQGLVAHNHNPSIESLREECLQFGAMLGYTVFQASLSYEARPCPCQRWFH